MSPTMPPNDHAGLNADSKAGRLRLACRELLHEHERKGDIPTNGRFLFYELEQRGHIPKKYDGTNPRTGKPFARTPQQDVSVPVLGVVVLYRHPLEL